MHVASLIDCPTGIKLLRMQVTENTWNFEVDFICFKKNKRMNSGAVWLPAEDKLTGSSNILQNSLETI